MNWKRVERVYYTVTVGREQGEGWERCHRLRWVHFGHSMSPSLIFREKEDSRDQQRRQQFQDLLERLDPFVDPATAKIQAACNVLGLGCDDTYCPFEDKNKEQYLIYLRKNQKNQGPKFSFSWLSFSSLAQTYPEFAFLLGVQGLQKGFTVVNSQTMSSSLTHHSLL